MAKIREELAIQRRRRRSSAGAATAKATALSKMSVPKRMSAFEEWIHFALTRTFQTFQDRKFLDLSIEEVPHNFKLVRNHITQLFQGGVSIVSGGTSFPANSLDLSGLYAEDLGNQIIRIGTSLNRPVMTLLGANPLVLQVNVESYSDPGCTAVDDDNNPLSVSVQT